ncbi:MAG: SPOR domain-containing protein, partial [Desulfatitalea sp.]|nr:SPOR domain-containing protein [Desulfatitalea sp.]
KAASGSRTWYQVKVSHFPTRDQARQYGEQLKTKGLIDDFYVANFTP